MIYALSGSPASVREGRVLLDVGLVTMELTMPQAQARELRIGEHAQVFTYLHFSSQTDQLKLFGFTSALARDLFVLLIGASGIGPGVAVALLDLGVPALVGAIRGEDERTLTKVSGVGPKLAKKVILELGDKLAQFAAVELPAQQRVSAAGSDLPQPLEDALSAVVALGFQRTRAETALQQFLAEQEEGSEPETVVLIRGMLARL